MFEFLFDMGNYADRCVGRYDDGDDKMVSTAQVSDGNQPYETAFQHPDYNDGSMVIVCAYSTREEAAEGHARWEAIMRDGQLPDELVECFNSKVGQMCEALGDEGRYPRKSNAA